MDGSVRFKKGVALPFLIAKATKAGKVFQDGTRPKNAMDLQKLEVLKCTPGEAKNFFTNKFNSVTAVRAQQICQVLDITPDEWRGITEPVRIELKTDEQAIITRFLNRLRSNGLSLAVKFSPRHRADLDLSLFCVPARVVTEEESSSLLGPVAREPGIDSVAEEILARGAAGVLLNSWLGRANRRVVIQGEPGEGKTTALWHYAAQLCGDCIHGHAASKPENAPKVTRVPLVLTLNQVPPLGNDIRSIVQIAIECTLAVGGPSDRQFLHAWLERKTEAKEVVLLLDALDELETNRISWLRQQLQSVGDIPVVLTTRYHAEPRRVLPQHTLLRMVPFRWWIIDEFIVRFFEGAQDGIDRANELRRTLRVAPSLRQLARNPFLLGVMCHLKEEGATAMPKTKTQFLRAALVSLLQRGDQARLVMRAGHENTEVRPLRDEAKMDVLAEVAWHFQGERPKPMPAEDLLRVLDLHRGHIRWESPSDAHALLAEFVRDGVLVKSGSGPYSFLLRRFQEYCLARRIARMLDSNIEVAEVSSGVLRGRANAWRRSRDWGDIRPLNQPAWAEVWPLVAGSLKGNPVLIDALASEVESTEDILSSRLAMLAESLGEFLRDETNIAIVGHSYETLALKTIESILDLVAIEPPLSGTPHSWRSLLARLPAEVVVQKLVDRIAKSKTHQTADSYSHCLGEIGTPDARDHLIAIVCDKRGAEIVRANAAVGLGLIGDTESRQVLFSWLKQSIRDNKKYLHYGCVSGLALVADEPARQALADLMKSATDPDARLHCIEKCEHLFGAEIEGEMLRCAEASTDFVREHLAQGDRPSDWEVSERNVIVSNCCSALGRIGGLDAARRLFKLLPAPLSLGTKAKICQAIAESGDDASRQELRRLATEDSPDRGLSILAALALIQVGDEKLLHDLLRVASSVRCPEHLRAAVAKACGDTVSTEVIRFLADRLLHDQSAHVKLAAAKSLARRRSLAACSAMRRALSLQLPQDLRFECACGLASNGDAEATRFLVGILKKKKAKDEIRSAAAQALGRSKLDIARDALREVFEKSDKPGLRARCKDLLRVIQREQGWRPLVKGGWDAP